MSERTEPAPGSEPEGPGYGREWRPQAGALFMGHGAYVRSVIGALPPPAKGLVAVDLDGHWNHGANDVHSIVLYPELAHDLARMLVEAADQAVIDCAQWLKDNPEDGDHG